MSHEKGLLSSLKESLLNAADTVKEKAIDAVDVATGGDTSPFKDKAAHAAAQRTKSTDESPSSRASKMDKIVIHLRDNNLPPTKEADISVHGTRGYDYNANGGYIGDDKDFQISHSASTGFREPRLGNFDDPGYPQSHEITSGRRADIGPHGETSGKALHDKAYDKGLLDLGIETKEDRQQSRKRSFGDQVSNNPEESKSEKHYLKENPFSEETNDGSRGAGTPSFVPSPNKEGKEIKTGMYGATFPSVPQPYVRKSSNDKKHHSSYHIFGKRNLDRMGGDDGGTRGVQVSTLDVKQQQDGIEDWKAALDDERSRKELTDTDQMKDPGKTSFEQTMGKSAETGDDQKTVEKETEALVYDTENKAQDKSNEAILNVGKIKDQARNAPYNVKGKISQADDTITDSTYGTCNEAGEWKQTAKSYADQPEHRTACEANAAVDTISGAPHTTADGVKTLGGLAKDEALEIKGQTAQKADDLMNATAEKAYQFKNVIQRKASDAAEKTEELKDAAQEKADDVAKVAARGVGAAAGTAAGVASSVADAARSAGYAGIGKATELKNATVNAATEVKGAAERKASDAAEKAGELKDAALEKADDVAKVAARGVGAAAGTAAGVASSVADAARSAGYAGIGKATELKNATVNAATEVKDAAERKVSDAVEKVGELKTAAGEQAWHATSATARGVGTAAGTVAGTIGVVAEKAADLKNVALDTAVGLKDTAKEKASYAANATAEGAKNVVGGVVGVAGVAADTAKDAGNAVLNKVVEAKDAVIDKAARTSDRIGDMKESAVDTVYAVANQTAEKGGEMKDATFDMAAHAVDSVKGAAGAVVDAVKSTGETAKEKAIEASNVIGDRASRVKDVAADKAIETKDVLAQRVGEAAEKVGQVKDYATESVSSAVSKTAEKAGDFKEGVKGRASSAVDKAWNVKDIAVEKVHEMKDVAMDEAQRKKVSVEERLKRKASDIVEKATEIKGTLPEKAEEMKDSATAKMHEMKETTSGTAQKTQQKVEGQGILTNKPIIDRDFFNYPDSDLYHKQIFDVETRPKTNAEDSRESAASKWNQQPRRGVKSENYRQPYSYGYIHLSQDGAGFDPKTYDFAQDTNDLLWIQDSNDNDLANNIKEDAEGLAYQKGVEGIVKDPAHNIQESPEESDLEIVGDIRQRAERTAGKDNNLDDQDSELYTIKSAVKDTAQDWKDGATQLAEEAKAKVSQLKDAATTKIQELKRASIDNAVDVKDKVGQKTQDLKDEIKDAYEQSANQERRTSDGLGYFASILTATKETVVDAATALKDKAAEAYQSVTEPKSKIRGKSNDDVKCSAKELDNTKNVVQDVKDNALDKVGDAKNAASNFKENVAAKVANLESQAVQKYDETKKSVTAVHSKPNESTYQEFYRNSAPDGSTSNAGYYEVTVLKPEGNLGSRSSTPNRSQPREMSGCAKDHVEALEQMGNRIQEMADRLQESI